MNYLCRPRHVRHLEAILAKDDDWAFGRATSSYSTVLAAYVLTPAQFNQAAREIPRLHGTYSQLLGTERQERLDAIGADTRRRADLLRMDEPYLAASFDAMLLMPPERRRRLPDGALAHPANIAFLVWHALPAYALGLDAQRASRGAVLEAVAHLPAPREAYLNGIGLRTLMHQRLAGGPLAVLQLFDQEFVRRTGERSLFDLCAPEHLHPWDFSPQHYWQDPRRVQDAVYHVVGEQVCAVRAALRTEGDARRAAVVHALYDSYGELVTLARHDMPGPFAGENGTRYKQSVIGILRAFDAAYQRGTGDLSLLDATRRPFLRTDRMGRLRSVEC
jgi:hypothetical protein